MDRKSGARTKGFTLIELLVVIAIIALLLAIVLPALNAVKEQAKKVVCLSNHKGMGQLVLLYAQDNDDQLISLVADSYGRGDRGSDHYTYFQTFHTRGRSGPSGLGWLWKQGYIESGSDLPYCPSMYILYGTMNKAQGWNPNGKVTHWNYCGTEPDSGTVRLDGAPQQAQILWTEDYGMEWLPLRVTIGTRMLRAHYKDDNGKSRSLADVQNDSKFNVVNQFKRVSDASFKGKRALLSDLWAAQQGTYLKTEYDDIPHKSGHRRAMNAWNLDGSADTVKMEDSYFDAPDPSTGTRLLRADITWAEMFD